MQINKKDLMELNVTVDKGWKSGSSRDPISLYFTAKEYTNQFGIYTGGIYGRWTEVTETLEDNRKVKIKIDKTSEDFLNSEEVVPIYYLSDVKLGTGFNEKEFNDGATKSHHRVLALFLFFFLLGLYKIFFE